MVTNGFVANQTANFTCCRLDYQQDMVTLDLRFAGLEFACEQSLRTEYFALKDFAFNRLNVASQSGSARSEIFAT